MNSRLLLLALVLSFAFAEEGKSDVIVLTESTFDAQTAQGEWLLEFYAPWCGHCKKLAPTYEELATAVKGKYNIAKIDCTVEKDLASRFGVSGYPTIKFLKDGKVYDYSGQRTVDAFTAFLHDGYKTAATKPIPQKRAETATEGTKTTQESNVVTLTDSNFDSLTSKGVWFLKFYAPWCGHCKKLAPIYEDVATQLKGKVNVGKIDCTAEKVICSQYDIQGYPTVYYVRDGEMRSYNGQRNVEGFKQYADGGWQKVDAEPVPAPVSAWKVALVNLVGQLEELLSLNVWVVVAIVITVGILLGVVVVLLTPVPQPKVIHYQNPAPTSSSSASIQEITEDEITSKED